MYCIVISDCLNLAYSSLFFFFVAFVHKYDLSVAILTNSGIVAAVGHVTIAKARQ